VFRYRYTLLLSRVNRRGRKRLSVGGARLSNNQAATA
jgi:hypothetical protein